MNPGISLDYQILASDSRFTKLAGMMASHSVIDSPASFNGFCRDVCAAWKASVDASAFPVSPLYGKLLAEIAAGGPAAIQTSWGGVAITRHEHPLVEKYLVIRKGGYLALEEHALKDERLAIVEGAGLLLHQTAFGHALTVQALTPGDEFHFVPGIAHCIIGTENLLVFERSTDPKGMDQDLIFLYEPD